MARREHGELQDDACKNTVIWVKFEMGLSVLFEFAVLPLVVLVAKELPAAWTLREMLAVIGCMIFVDVVLREQSRGLWNDRGNKRLPGGRVGCGP